MPSIFDLTEEQKGLMKMVEDGDLSQEDAADTFESMTGELNDKINDYCRVRNIMLGDLGSIQSEIERLKDLEVRKKNQIKKLTETLRIGLSAIDKTSFDTGLFNGYFRKGSKSIKVIDNGKIPEEYIITKVTEQVDKTQLKKDIESGAVKCDGVEIVTGDSSLIIK